MKNNPKEERARRAILAGGSGFLGCSLAAELCAGGWEVIVLTRSPDKYRGRGRAVKWDGHSLDGWVGEVDGAEVVVNLAGKNVNCRPTRKNRDEILTSRVNSVRVLGEAVRACTCAPRTWLQAGSLAIYGNPGDRVCNEDAPFATEFPANVCTAWEGALEDALLPDMRSVVLRIGFVLGRSGGALPFLTKLARWGLGGTIGSGRQWMSWMHLEDMNRIFLEAIDNENWAGVYNTTGPEPVRNREFMRELRRALACFWSPPAPPPAVWVGSWILGSDPKISLTGRRCSPARLTESGFSFKWPGLKGALGDLIP